MGHNKQRTTLLALLDGDWLRDSRKPEAVDNMHIVGKHLSDYATSIRGTSPDDGLFARSAFNRYYYAAFLASRQFLIETTGSGGMPHKALPEYFIGHFQKTMKRQIHAGFKSGTLTPSARSQMLTALKENALLLSDLLVQAYSVRVLADYQPDVPVEVKDETFRLGVSTLPAASHWANRAQMYCKNLRKIWKDLGN